MVKEGRPRRGSLAFWPRKRARRIYPAITRYPKEEKARILGFAGYKAGMTHSILLDTRKSSLTSGQEIAVPVTIIDCPPMRAISLRFYKNTSYGLKVFDEVWTKDLPKELGRKIKLGNRKTEELAEGKLNEIFNLRLVVCTQPKISAVGKKKPEIFEIEVGGKEIKEKLDFAKQFLGKDIRASDVLKEGEFVDVSAVTKGKGTAGVVKRFGIRIQDRHAKKKKRHIGTLGPQTPRKVRWTVPQAGQLGFQTRTELNKRVIKIGESGEEINPKSGLKRYGLIKGNYIVIEGSIPGPKKRLIMIRPAIRAGRVKLLIPEVREIVK